MTYTTDKTTQKAFEQFQRFDVDTQLALLWYGYLDIKEQLQPTPTSSTEDTGEALFDRIKAGSKEEQLQAQRDIATCANTDISKAYSALSSSGKIFLWLRLAQGMEKGAIVQLPSDYQLPSETKEFVNQVKKLNFEQRINLTRSVVVEMGAK
ncbi:orange carotenoid protein N-terminal domain-containing protein [Egbenema bharatensis]|uniref:orange carotenoid protein N-terminal domain-containing protein n=1 Tax=Egbenema bharatensis TaxID=3463334 RepID=UPI003A8AE932